MVRNEIVSGVHPAGSTYRLAIEAVGNESLAIEAVNTESLRQHYKANVSFVLYDNNTGKPVYSGKTFSQVAYDRVDAPAANLQAQVNAQERAAREVGQDIRTHVWPLICRLSRSVCPFLRQLTFHGMSNHPTRPSRPYCSMAPTPAQ